MNMTNVESAKNKVPRLKRKMQRLHNSIKQIDQLKQELTGTGLLREDFAI